MVKDAQKNAKDSKERMEIRRKVVVEALANESPEVREQVATKTRELKEEREADGKARKERETGATGGASGLLAEDYKEYV